MKQCAYCGRENPEEAQHCAGCGTTFPAPQTDAPPRTPREWTWVEWLAFCLRCLGITLGIGVVYLLSLGPVERYVVRVTSRTSTTTTNAVTHSTMITTTITMSCPQWVQILYRPAYLLGARTGGNGLYGHYLEWWASGRRAP